MPGALASFTLAGAPFNGQTVPADAHQYQVTLTGETFLGANQQPDATTTRSCIVPAVSGASIDVVFDALAQDRLAARERALREVLAEASPAADLAVAGCQRALCQGNCAAAGRAPS